MKLLPQLQACSFERVGVVTPVAPARSNGHDDGVHQGDLPQVLENLRVLVILDAVANGLQTNSRSRFGGSDRTRRIEEDSIARSSEPATARSGIHIVPTADGVSGGPAIGAIVKNPRCPLRPIQEPGLDALVDRRIVHHPFWSVAEPRVATGIAPEVAPGGKRQSGPLLQGIEQHPMIDGTV